MQCEFEPGIAYTLLGTRFGLGVQSDRENKTHKTPEDEAKEVTRRGFFVKEQVQKLKWQLIGTVCVIDFVPRSLGSFTLSTKDPPTRPRAMAEPRLILYLDAMAEPFGGGSIAMCKKSSLYVFGKANIAKIPSQKLSHFKVKDFQ